VVAALRSLALVAADAPASVARGFDMVQTMAPLTPSFSSPPPRFLPTGLSHRRKRYSRDWTEQTAGSRSKTVSETCCRSIHRRSRPLSSPLRTPARFAHH
jgi:hypothetical protein